MKKYILPSVEKALENIPTVKKKHKAPKPNGNLIQTVTQTDRKEFKRKILAEIQFDQLTKKQYRKLVQQLPRWQRKIAHREYLRARKIRKGKPIKKGRKPQYKYNEYIKSREWAERRNRFYQTFGRKCKICGSTTFIELHHMVYTAFDGTEPDWNLVALCKSHHMEYHEEYGSSGNMRETTIFFIEQSKERKPYLISK